MNISSAPFVFSQPTSANPLNTGVTPPRPPQAETSGNSAEPNTQALQTDKNAPPRTVEASQRTERQNPNTRDKSEELNREPNNSENDDDAIELRPLVVETSANPAIRAFQEVGQAQDNFQIIDTYA